MCERCSEDTFLHRGKVNRVSVKISHVREWVKNENRERVGC